MPKSLATIAGAIFLMFTGAAFAADVAPFTKAPTPTSYDWSGLYIGGHLGGGWETADFQDPSAGTNLTICCRNIGFLAPGAAAANGNNSSFLGGGQIGWNYQIGRLVLGNEFDFTGMSLNAGSTASYPGATTPAAVASETFGIRTDWTATATTVLGLARDRWLWFNKLGVAWAHDDYSLGLSGTNCCFGPGGPFSFASTTSETRLGWTVGTGIAWAFADNWSMKVEYDFLDFANKGVDFTGVISNATGSGFGAITSPFTFNTNNTQYISEVKVGVNYKFSPGFLFW
jgi:outer membrane immunogenic protein